MLSELGYEINLESEYSNGEPISEEKNIVIDLRVDFTSVVMGTLEKILLE